MYPQERLTDIWHLEIFLFGGVPEVAEPMFERVKDTSGVHEVRETRRHVNSSARKGEATERKILFRWKYDSQKERIVYLGRP